MSNKDIIRKAFAILTEPQKKRLRYHAEKGTPILCGSLLAKENYIWEGYT